MKRCTPFFAAAAALLLAACGTLTGIPAHGGGKRFAVEQELVAASARAAVKNMDLHALQGHKVAVYVSVMGDQGSGTINGGRYSVDALIRGEYLNAPASRSEYTYPRYQTTAQTSSGGLDGITTSVSTLNAPAHSRTKSDGGGSRSSIGFNAGGIGEYRNETLTTNPQDASFLTNLIQTVFYLRGIELVPPEYADTDVFVTVDVFGTIRSRTEMHLYNAETLKAQTKLEYFAVDRNSRKLLISPRSAAYEARYRENYALWTGPFKVEKNLKPAAALMVDFSDITPYADTRNGENSAVSAPTPDTPDISEEKGTTPPDPALIRHRRD